MPRKGRFADGICGSTGSRADSHRAKQEVEREAKRDATIGLSTRGEAVLVVPRAAPARVRRGADDG
jgi:hypothetical protein